MCFRCVHSPSLVLINKSFIGGDAAHPSLGLVSRLFSRSWWRVTLSPSVWLIFPSVHSLSRHRSLNVFLAELDCSFAGSMSHHPFSRNPTPGDELFINQASGVMSRCDRSPNHTLTSFWRGEETHPETLFLSWCRPLFLVFTLSSRGQMHKSHFNSNSCLCTAAELCKHGLELDF